MVSAGGKLQMYQRYLKEKVEQRKKRKHESPLNQQKLKQSYYNWRQQNLLRLADQLPAKNNILQHDRYPQDYQCWRKHPKQQCMYCTNEFYQNQPFPPTKQPYSLLNCLINQQAFIQKFKTKICGLLNNGGGYLFITREENQLVMGVQWLEESEYKWRQFVKGQKQCIFPQSFQMDVSEVKVLSREGNSHIKKSMIRVAVVPNLTKLTFFTVKRVDNFRPSYVCYFLNETDKNKLHDVSMVSFTCYYYKIILSKFDQYNSQSNKQNQGYPIKNCRNPYNMCVQPKIDQISISKLAQILDKVQIEEQKFAQAKNFVPASAFKIVKDQQPRMVYKYQSLFILKSETDDGYIELIKRSLQKNKMPCCLFMKPFQSHRNNSTKSIWFVTHDYSFDIVKKIIDNQLAQKQNVGALAFISCTKFIKAEGQIDQKFQNFIQVFEQYYGRKLKPVRANYNKNKKLWDYCFKLETYQQSVFAFVFLQNQRIRSLFTKQSVYEAMKAEMLGTS